MAHIAKYCIQAYVDSSVKMTEEIEHAIQLDVKYKAHDLETQLANMDPGYYECSGPNERSGKYKPKAVAPNYKAYVFMVLDYEKLKKDFPELPGFQKAEWLFK